MQGAGASAQGRRARRLACVVCLVCARRPFSPPGHRRCGPGTGSHRAPAGGAGSASPPPSAVPGGVSEPGVERGSRRKEPPRSEARPARCCGRGDQRPRAGVATALRAGLPRPGRDRGPALDPWLSALPDVVRRFDMGETRDGRRVPAVEFGLQAGPVALEDRPTAFLLGGLDGLLPERRRGGAGLRRQPVARQRRAARGSHLRRRAVGFAGGSGDAQRRDSRPTAATAVRSTRTTTVASTRTGPTISTVTVPCCRC